MRRCRTSSRRIRSTDSLQSLWCKMSSLTKEENMQDRIYFRIFFWKKADSSPSLTNIQRICHENCIWRHTKDQLMVPSIWHLLPIRHSQLHVHSCHGNSTFTDPACEPGDQLDPSPGVKVKEAARHFPPTRLLCPLDKLSMSCTWTNKNTCLKADF